MDQSPLQVRVDRILQKLRTVMDGGFHPFGFELHGFRTKSPLSESEVAAFESRHSITLPDGYRAFITQVCDGAAGPALGMYSLAKATEKDGALPYDYLQTPFPHVSYYKPSDDPLVEAMWARVERGEVSEAEADHQALYRTAGTLDLCHEGCGYLHFLVVTGPTRGKMWINGEDSDQGFLPLGVDFLEWYERWLDSTLAGGSGVWWLSAPQE